MNKFINRLFITWGGKLVGKDEFGNKYYENRKVDRTFGRKSRNVIYKGMVEASKVPAHWSIWLHHQTSEPPKSNVKTYKWEKFHTPNLTGTNKAYLPSGHVLAKSKREKATGDYEAWEPK